MKYNSFVFLHFSVLLSLWKLNLVITQFSMGLSRGQLCRVLIILCSAWWERMRRVSYGMKIAGIVAANGTLTPSLPARVKLFLELDDSSCNTVDNDTYHCKLQ